jgi:hypothetical protein
MKLYHRTTQLAAEAIMRAGFRDGRGFYMTSQEWEGVWLSSKALDENEGAVGPVLLSIKIPQKTVAQYEWIQEGLGPRVSCAGRAGEPLRASSSGRRPIRRIGQRREAKRRRRRREVR